MKRFLAILFISSLCLTSCGLTSSAPAVEPTEYQRQLSDAPMISYESATMTSSTDPTSDEESTPLDSSRSLDESEYEEYEYPEDFNYPVDYEIPNPDTAPSWDGFSTKGELPFDSVFHIALRQGEWLYYLNYNENKGFNDIYRIKTDEKERQLIFDSNDKKNIPYGIALADGKLMIEMHNNNSSYFHYALLDLKGPFPQSKVEAFEGSSIYNSHDPEDYAFATPAYLYYYCIDSYILYFSERDGSNMKALATNVYNVLPQEDCIIFQIDDYWYKVDFDGKNPAKAPNEDSAWHSLFNKYSIMQDKNIYYENSESGEQIEMPITGGLKGSVPDGEYEYVSTSDGIYKVSMVTFDTEKISDVKFADSMSIIDDWIFFRIFFYNKDFSEFTSPTMRMKKDGSCLQKLP